ncbi:hypothetical protein DNU06_10550 [Putridiphycobacter roseus]|uniref:Outer membrane protein beta-barrel domain-containing protein n=1 Tax=Putridiphycobacter roseus TaxID=2219161 RepID=A0A2W1NF99_9FLAO|nr:hypothetical protein [Putridiphycobacter roseus]PZE16696.1 hypothetical protein DNU06_10550 [Putridiphycobacter roseus]
MKFFSLLFIVMIFGNTYSQISFFAAPALYSKLSFNSNSLSDWKSDMFDLSDDFNYNNRSVYVGDPLLGATLGVTINNRHCITASGSWDGVSSKITIQSPVYSSHLDFSVSDGVLTKGTTAQSRFFLNYSYNFRKKPLKSTLFLNLLLGFGRRAGPALGGLDVGGFSTEYALSPEKNLFFENVGYTSGPTSTFQFGAGLSSDLFIKKKYLFSLSLDFSYSQGYLYYEVTKVTVTNTKANTQENFRYYTANMASGIYFGISRKFQIFSLERD